MVESPPLQLSWSVRTHFCHPGRSRSPRNLSAPSNFEIVCETQTKCASFVSFRGVVHGRPITASPARKERRSHGLHLYHRVVRYRSGKNGGGGGRSVR